MNADERLSPDQALQEIDRVDQHVRRSARGVARMFLIMGLGSMVYWPAMALGPGVVAGVAGVGCIVLTVVSCVYWARIRVHDRYVMRVNGPASAAFVVTTLLTFAFVEFVFLDHRGPVWVAALIAISVVAGLPLVYAAWRILRTR